MLYLSLHASPTRQRYNSQITSPLARPFSEAISRVLVADASGRAVRKAEAPTLAHAIGFRILDIILGQQSVDASNKVELTKFASAVPTDFIGLRVGLPYPPHPRCSAKLGPRRCRVSVRISTPLDPLKQRAWCIRGISGQTTG
jgi:hypothetical protein